MSEWRVLCLAPLESGRVTTATEHGQQGGAGQLRAGQGQLWSPHPRSGEAPGPVSPRPDLIGGHPCLGVAPSSQVMPPSHSLQSPAPQQAGRGAGGRRGLLWAPNVPIRLLPGSPTLPQDLSPSWGLGRAFGSEGHPQLAQPGSREARSGGERGVPWRSIPVCPDPGRGMLSQGTQLTRPTRQGLALPDPRPPKPPPRWAPRARTCPGCRREQALTTAVGPAPPQLCLGQARKAFVQPSSHLTSCPCGSERLPCCLPPTCLSRPPEA